MKKAFLILGLATLLVGCEAETIESQSYSNNIQVTYDCKVITSAGEDNRGDYIEVCKDPTSNYAPDQKRERFKVQDYRMYDLGDEICSFDGLTKQPL